jgi:hypothetical protein
VGVAGNGEGKGSAGVDSVAVGEDETIVVAVGVGERAIDSAAGAEGLSGIDPVGSIAVDAGASDCDVFLLSRRRNTINSTSATMSLKTS